MKIRAGIIGTGIGLKHLQSIENYKNSKVDILCEKNLKNLRKIKKKFPNKIITNNENEIFKNEKINLVSIASYDDDHYKQIIKSINTGKNIVVEKPMCLNPKQLKKIYGLIKKNKKIKITSNLVLRVNSLFKDFKKRINRKKIFYIEADYIWGRYNKLFGWRSKVKEYSLTLGAAIHMIDLVCWLLGSRPIYVKGYGHDKITKKTKFKKKSLIVMVLTFPNNILVKLTANGAATHDHFHSLKIFEKNRTFENSTHGAFVYTKDAKTKIKSRYPDKDNRKNLIQNFIDSLINKKIKPIISLKEQFDLMNICFAVDKSIKLNRTVKIKYF